MECLINLKINRDLTMNNYLISLGITGHYTVSLTV